MRFLITGDERDRLYGLPHLHQIIYYVAIRPFMDYATGIVGLKRGVSYQSILEEIFVEAHSGRVIKQVSRDQVKRALKSLERRGLIKMLSSDRKLILCCLCAEQDNLVKNKPALNPPEYLARANDSSISVKSDTFTSRTRKLARDKTGKPAIPPVSGNLFFLFEKFWESYPQKCGREKAYEEFERISPTEELFNSIMSGLDAQKKVIHDRKTADMWVPNWKYPANWLSQRAWEDDLSGIRDLCYSTKYQTHGHHARAKLIWDSCKGVIRDH